MLFCVLSHSPVMKFVILKMPFFPAWGSFLSCIHRLILINTWRDPSADPQVFLCVQQPTFWHSILRSTVTLIFPGSQFCLLGLDGLLCLLEFSCPCGRILSAVDNFMCDPKWTLEYPNICRNIISKYTCEVGYGRD